jgi:3-methyladenine DNA glycosylase/8-oxoguanine DNA glycosylase
MFDLDANPRAIHQILMRDAVLESRIRKSPGLRLPGAWDPFEAIVRAVVGQQISVKGAVTQLGRIARLAGMPYEDGKSPLTRFFPNAMELAATDMTRIGMPQKRRDTLREIAHQMGSGKLSLDTVGNLSDFVHTLTCIAGVGDWTANYVAMRALGEPDAFPASDLGILKALQTGAVRPSVKQATQHAEAWRPWRAYAAVYLWQGE